MNHLKNRVENSRGNITVPNESLVSIFISFEYQNCQNLQLKRITTELIFSLLSLSLKWASLKIDAVQFTKEILNSMQSQLSILDKARLFIMMAWYYIQSKADVMLMDEALQGENKKIFLQMVTVFTIATVSCPYNHWKSSLKPIFQGQVSSYHTDDSKLTPVAHSQKFEEFFLITILQNTALFTSKEVVGVMIVATQDQQSCSSGVRYSCDAWIRSQTLDLEDSDLERILYNLVNGSYNIYSDCVNSLCALIEKPSEMALRHFIGWIMKLETRTEVQKKIQVINHCLFIRPETSLHRQGLMFTRQIIREDPDLNETDAQSLKQTLSSVISLSQFDEDLQALAVLFTAELASKYFNLVVGQSIELALMTFENLKQRIKITLKNIREDDLCLTYMEALNKLRDCYEQHLTDQVQKDLLMSKIVSFLYSQEASEKKNAELLYIVYLYVARLDKDKLTAPLLLHSVNLKDHPDIKIRKEALSQLERFENKNLTNFLGPFMEQIRLWFLSLENPMLSLIVENISLKQGLQYNTNLSVYADSSLIEKIEELSQYALKFYLDDKNNQSQVERLLMLNLNQNFTQIKSDFKNSLNIIKKYLKHTQGKGAGVIVSAEGAMYINKAGTNTSNLDQRILALKLLFILFKRQEGLYQQSEQFVIDNQPKSHEQKMIYLYNLSLRVYFSQNDNDKFIQLLKDVCVPITPNIIEEQKLLANCLAQMTFIADYQPAIDTMLTNITNRQLEANYKCKVIKCLPKICQNNQELCNQIEAKLGELVDFDETRVQTCIGKSLVIMWNAQSKLLNKVQEIISQVQKQGVELNSKRNLVIYLYEAVNKYASESSEMREKYFVEIQQTLLRFLFDRRSFMQDLASKGLSLVYKLGNEEQRQLLITSLSETFSGTGPTKKKEQDAEQELLLDFSNSTNSEQREKLKTYKDLVRVAEELGQRDLIYQFLEVHRHNQAHQDIKNAAKGISSLLMLDEKIRVSLIKIAPKILLMTYDPNQEVQDTMRQLWSSLIPVNEESSFITDRWSEIFTSCVSGIKSEAWRSRQAACLCLTDLIQAQTRKWQDISKEYRIIFLTSLALMSDDAKDSVKHSAFKLVKALRSFTLKFCNMYSNTDLKQLEEVLDITVPLVLDDCLKSMVTKVRQFGLHILAELIKSTQSQNLAEKLKINNKYERQLVFNGNSSEVMSRLLCAKQYLQRIITEMVLNISSIQDKANSQLNYAEQLQADGKLKIGQQELAEISMRYSRESIQGEILKICRSLMTQETFDAVLVTLLLVIQKSNYDNMTKQTASAYIQDVVLENITMISPQNAKKIAQKVISVYAAQTNAQNMKDALVSSYASCFGLQFKILRAFPNTVKQILGGIKDLNKDMLYIKFLHFYQIIRYSNKEMLEDLEICQDLLPLIFIHRFNQSDTKLSKLCEKIWEQYLDSIGGNDKLSQLMAPFVLVALLDSFDSSSYADRIAASQAFQQIVKFSKDEEIVQQTTSKLISILKGKYFLNKEQIVKVFTAMVEEEIIDIDKEDYINSMLSQITNLNLDSGYRNYLLKSFKHAMPKIANPKLFDILINQLDSALQSILDSSQASLLLESQGQFFDFNERKENEQAILTQLINIFELLPLITNNEEQQQKLDKLCIANYGKTNWIVRRSILQCYVKLVNFQTFGIFLVQQVADCGEKFELNLSLISDITYKTLNSLTERSQNLKSAALKIVELLAQRTNEDLRRNIDVIKQLCK